ncbi:hypothetical protein [Persephonella sp. IF05-L8]|uniref:hypothetical protein n=1 Tax=Persephonella sp. IF05-L8 TaxID=1158338 RepID=UPI000496AF15
MKAIQKILKYKEDNKDYKLLYEYAINTYNEIIETSRKLDEKAQKFAIVISLFFTFQAIVFKVIIQDNYLKKTILEKKCFTVCNFDFKIEFLYYFLIIIIFITILISLLSIYYILDVLKIESRKMLPMEEKVISLYKNHSEKTFILSLAKKVIKINDFNEKNIEKKSEYLTKVHKMFKYILFSLFAEIINFFIIIICKSF